MDFEWQHRAPQDVTSPFYQLSVQHENRKREHFLHSTMAHIHPRPLHSRFKNTF